MISALQPLGETLLNEKFISVARKVFNGCLEGVKQIDCFSYYLNKDKFIGGFFIYTFSDNEGETNTILEPTIKKELNYDQ